jgi:IS5 family transposase
VWVQGSSRPDRELLDAAALCGHLLAPGSVAAFLAEHRRELFPDEMFADLFGSGRGRPSVPAEVIAVVMVLQALEGLSDRQAVRRLETDITWKAAAGLSLADGAFDHTVLVLWRNKLRASARPQRIFDAVRELIRASGAIKGKTRRALDSTVLDDAVARQDTIDMLVTQIRRVRRLIPDLVSVPVREDNLAGTGRPPCDWNDPADIDRVVSELVDDANELVWASEELQGLSQEQTDALALLALVAGQDVEPGERPGQWRIATRTAPDRVISVVDPETRHVHKTVRSYRDGYKAHVAVEPDTGLVTNCEITAGNTPDADTAEKLIRGDRGCREVLGDSAYGAGRLRRRLAEANKRTVIKPPPLHPAVVGGFTIDDFEISPDRTTMCCPAGATVELRNGRADFARHCEGCQLRSLCTTAQAGRTIALHPDHEFLAAARKQADTVEFDHVYRNKRPMVERSLAWLTRGTNRRLRFRGIERNRLGWAHRCAAINLQRLLTLGLAAGPDGTWSIA